MSHRITFSRNIRVTFSYPDRPPQEPAHRLISTLAGDSWQPVRTPAGPCLFVLFSVYDAVSPWLCRAVYA